MDIFKVLVVDDEPGICSGIKRILENFRVSYPFMDEDIGYEVIEAASGEIAIDILKTDIPEIILLDNKLPGIQGVEVLEYIKKNQIDSVVVMITSFASLEVAVKATNNGAYDFIPKPFTPQELKSSMENITKHIFLQRMSKKLNEQGKKIRFQFLSYLSHELKAPLNAIEGYLHIIQQKQLGENVSDYKEIIERANLRIKGMRELIMDMLDFTRLQAPITEQKLEEVNLVQVVKNAIDIIRPYSIQKDLKIKLNVEDNIYYMSVQEDMEIILNNLISNAVKYNKDNGKVDINLNKDDKFVFIEVEDTGIGMDEEEIKPLFNDFYRIKKTETKNIPGSGLGLSIVKKITEKYSGRIELNSKPGQGTVFRVMLPIQ